MSSNYPPGVTESMIPGNRPQDVEAERYRDELDDADLLGYIVDADYDCPGGVIYPHPDDESVMVMEQPWHGEPMLTGWPTATFNVREEEHTWLVFEDRDEAVAYMLAFHDDLIIEAMVTEHLEEEPPDPY